MVYSANWSLQVTEMSTCYWNLILLQQLYSTSCLVQIIRFLCIFQPPHLRANVFPIVIPKLMLILSTQTPRIFKRNLIVGNTLTLSILCLQLSGPHLCLSNTKLYGASCFCLSLF